MSTVAIKPWVEVVALHPDVVAETLLRGHLRPRPGAAGRRQRRTCPPSTAIPSTFSASSYLTKGLRGLLAGRAFAPRRRGGKPRAEADDAFRRRQVAHPGLAVPRRPASRRPWTSSPRAQDSPETRRGADGRIRRPVLRRDQRQGDPRREVPRPYPVGLDRLVARRPERLRIAAGPGRGPHRPRRRRDPRPPRRGAEPDPARRDAAIPHQRRRHQDRADHPPRRDPDLPPAADGRGRQHRTTRPWSSRSSRASASRWSTSTCCKPSITWPPARTSGASRSRGTRCCRSSSVACSPSCPRTPRPLPAATAYQEIVTQMRRAYAQSAAERQQAEEDGLALRDRVRAAYPFHPALIDLMRERWAAIPDFQRTRGALRFLAACLRACHREGKSRAVLGPGDVPIHDSEVRLAFFKEVGQQADFQAVLEHDLIGANARCRRIDDRRAKENADRGDSPAGDPAGHGDPDVFVRRPAAGERARRATSCRRASPRPNCSRSASAPTSTARRRWPA